MIKIVLLKTRTDSSAQRHMSKGMYTSPHVATQAYHHKRGLSDSGPRTLARASS
jgi:hypothetical protein